MQYNCYSCSTDRQGSSDSHSSASAPTSAASVDFTPVFPGVPVDTHEAVPPVIENNGGSLTTLLPLAEAFGIVTRVPTHPAAWNLNYPLLVPLTSREYSMFTRIRSLSVVEAGGVRAHMPQTAGQVDASLGPGRLDSRQVPSERTDQAISSHWPQRGDNYHAVAQAEAPAQPTLGYDPLFYSVRSWPYSHPDLATTTTTNHAAIGGLDTVSPLMADPVLWQVPSPSNRRRSLARAEPVTCEMCGRSMRRQSLRRHIKEVHDHIRRSHPRSRVATQAKF